MLHAICLRSVTAACTTGRPATAWHPHCCSTTILSRQRIQADEAARPQKAAPICGGACAFAAGMHPGHGTACSAAASMVASGGTADAAGDMEPRVEEVMTPHPTVLKADMNVREAVHVLLDKDISGAPVVDASGKLVGVLSESDLIWKGAGVPQDHYLLPPVFLGFADAFIAIRDNPKIEEEVNKILARTVRDAMTTKVHVATPSMPMSEAASLMLAKQINLLPVVEGGKVVGVLTRHDILRGIYASKSPFL